MHIKTANAATLLLLCSALLTGCNVEYGAASTKAVHVADDKAATTRERPDDRATANANAATNATIAQLREDLRLANERARLAEEKAALEKRKREFAEELVRKFERADRTGEAEKSSRDKHAGGS